VVNTVTKQHAGKDFLTAGSEGWGFYCYIFAGVLLGWGADRWLGTHPIFIVVGLLIGSAMAFWRLWGYLKGEGQ
jgi:F0F1-type ATP synthase assembly protein I